MVTDIVARSNQPWWWRCDPCGHQWCALPSNRANPVLSRPACRNRRPRRENTSI
ncbi:zinc-ribbon domain-containing protein [Nocardia sp. FBN12]|uniref:zinc-ribbon domain-containing protein n=1 Tax=Nocardia sp. FBN12 TaxID=3419766 RepID=UPI003CFD7090